MYFDYVYTYKNIHMYISTYMLVCFPFALAQPFLNPNPALSWPMEKSFLIPYALPFWLFLYMLGSYVELAFIK